MGSSNSGDRNSRNGSDEKTPDPKRFYLILGKPQLRYYKEKWKGPLMFHLDEEGVYELGDGEASCYQMQASIPMKQKMELEPAGPNGSFESAKLHFDLSGSKPIRRLSVYVDVSVAYESGSGLMLKHNTHVSTEQHCVLSVLNAKPGRYVTSPFPLSRLDEHHFKQIAPTCATCRLTAAPITIVAYMGEGTSSHPNYSPRESPAVSPIPTISHGPPATTASPAPIRFNPIRDNSEDFSSIQYTFLSLPSVAKNPSPLGLQNTTRVGLTVENATRRKSKSLSFSSDLSATLPSQRVAPSSNGSPTVASPHSDANFVWENSVLRQLLQIGHEVYELEDVYEMGVGNETAHDAGADDGSEEDSGGDICAICLCNPKNTTLLPCRHMCCCEECAAQVRLTSNKCPICRAVIQKVMTL